MEHYLAHLVDSSLPLPCHTSESRSSQWIVDHMANHMEHSFQAPVYWMPIGVTQMWHDAGFVADEIVWFLERRVGFRRMKQALARLVESMPSIQGVRVAVSGRVGGRSKKSQRARCDVWKYGATPLHVFSQRIDYAQRIARTPLGTSGVSVWLVSRDSR
jgi:ribosomal protein S3